MEFLLKDRASWPVQIVVWFFAAYVAWSLVSLGYGKIMDPQAKFMFPAWVMMIVGIVEVVGPLMMFIPRTAFYGSLPVAVVMGVAWVMTGLVMPHLVLIVLSLIVAYVMRPDYLRKKAPITKISV